VQRGDCRNFENLRSAIEEILGEEVERTSAEHDDRLPLFRRRVFDRDLTDMLTAAKHSDEPLSLVMIDLDRFKEVNDTHGHPVGDEVLHEASQRLVTHVGAKGRLYRFGGEEIALLLSNYSTQEALALAERLRQVLERQPMSSRALKVTASLGVATYPEHAATGQLLLEKADGALLEAKELGRNLVRLSGEPRPTAPLLSREVDRRKPESDVLSESQHRALRMEYFKTGSARCPHDQAWLDVRRSDIMGQRTPDLHVSCPVCGLLAQLPGE
jgi:diguanylate cyclase (GGDEF)-like protein